MIQSEPIKEFPFELLPRLSEYAKIELELAGDMAELVILKSDQVRLISVDDKPLCICGVIRQSLLGVPRFWFLLCEAVAPKALRQLRSQVRELFEYYPMVETLIEQDYRHGERFARFYGFVKQDRQTFMFDKVYNVYEARP